MAQRYFGSPWPSGICVHGEQAPTPIGEKCLWCETTIRLGDRGYWIGVARMGSDGTSYGSVEPGHRECFLREGVGGIAHLERRCFCFGGTDPEDPDTPEGRRAEALEVWRRWTEGALVGE